MRTPLFHVEKKLHRNKQYVRIRLEGTVNATTLEGLEHVLVAPEVWKSKCVLLDCAGLTEVDEQLAYRLRRYAWARKEFRYPGGQSGVYVLYPSEEARSVLCPDKLGKSVTIYY
jgi:hypothetical protein